MDGEQRGTVFNIQHFSIQDGLGIRTVVFLKGCPLRCRWCANPESQNPRPEIAWTKGECIGCHGCRTLGMKDTADGICWDPSTKVDEEMAARIRRCCPSEALHVIGETKTVSDVMQEVRKDRAFFESSGGGMTLSGGEPMMQPAFSMALLKAARDERIRTCMETTCFASEETALAIAELLDNLIMDVKCLDSKKHRENTGVGNERILLNLIAIRKAYPSLPIRIRTPVIPGFNDTREDIIPIAELARREHCEYELLKYHKLGIPKYRSLHRDYPMGDADLSEKTYQRLVSLAEERSKGKST